MVQGAMTRHRKQNKEVMLLGQNTAKDREAAEILNVWDTLVYTVRYNLQPCHFDFRFSPVLGCGMGDWDSNRSQPKRLVRFGTEGLDPTERDRLCDRARFVIWAGFCLAYKASWVRPLRGISIFIPLLAPYIRFEKGNLGA